MIEASPSRNRLQQARGAWSPLTYGLLLPVLFMAPACLAQPPSNDNFADRQILTGTPVTFSGTLSAATWENYEPSGFFGWGGTVWWSWVSPDSSPATITVKTASGDNFSNDGINIWTNNYPGFPTNAEPAGPPVSGMPIDTDRVFSSLTFPTTAGTAYHIQLIGTSDVDYTFELMATNGPILLRQPQARTAPPGGSVLFTAAATGLFPLTYQWRLNGTNLVDETKATLARHGITTNHAGTYSVLITDASGTSESEPASLTVAAATTPPRFGSAAWNTNELRVQFQSDPGRSYRIESSNPLSSWAPEITFPLERNQWTSVISSGDGHLALTLPAGDPARFYRARVYVPANEACINNLKQIRSAKDLWGLHQWRDRTMTPASLDLVPYLDSEPLTCPLGGIYSYSSLTVSPTCSIPEHVLEEPR